MQENLDFDLGDLDLGQLSVVTMTDSVALPESGASYTSSSTCLVLPDPGTS
jgi:Thiopeptide-type bacteriocin precursor